MPPEIRLFSREGEPMESIDKVAKRLGRVVVEIVTHDGRVYRYALPPQAPREVPTFERFELGGDSTP